VAAGFDAVSVALAADAWSRTYRSGVFTIADSAGPVVDRTGIRLMPDRQGPVPPGTPLVEIPSGMAPATVLDSNLAAIGQRYGDATEQVVAMQLEYDGPARD
jgi:hypothetical protein